MNYIDIAKELIREQFPEYSDLPIKSVEVQGHDNRTFRLGDELLIRMPTADPYALKVAIEHKLLPQLAARLSTKIPVPVKLGKPTDYYPYPYSIYRWLDGVSANLQEFDSKTLETIAVQLVDFLKELQAIDDIEVIPPGQHNFWRGEHVSVYDENARNQIDELRNIIDSKQALKLWEAACATKWDREPVWVHGDFAVGNILIENGELVGVIDLGGMATGDPSCDLVIAWTFLEGKSREIFINAMGLDADTWLRARAWALWKATFELCNIEDKSSLGASFQKDIIASLLYL